MTAPDNWLVTSTEDLPNGNKRVSGIHTTRGPFRLIIPLEEYTTRGVHDAVRTFYDHHPTDLEARG